MITLPEPPTERLSLKTHVRILGWLYLVICSLTLAAGIALCVGTKLSRSPAALYYIGPLVTFAACFILIPGIIGGIGLLRYQRWAKMLILLLSMFLIPVVPIGTVLGVYGLWTLLNSETDIVFGEPKPGISVKAFFLEPNPTLNLLGVMACVGATFFLVIKIGFLIHHEHLPEPFDSTPLTVTAGLILYAGLVAVAILTIQSIRSKVAFARANREAKKSAAAYHEAKRQRIEELKSDPARAQYGALVEQGEEWSDAQIAYWESTGKIATCEHLHPIEQAMRRSGVELRLYKGQEVTAKCEIDFLQLKHYYTIPSCVRYVEFYAGDPRFEERPSAYLICDIHKSIIHTAHPEENIKGAWNFPGTAR